MAKQQTAPSEERVTLEATINTHGLTKDINTIGHLHEMADLANVEVIWDQISTDWGERKSVMLASGEVPDMFIDVWTFNQGDLAQFPTLFLDMTDLIQEHAPNVQQMFLEKPELEY